MKEHFNDNDETIIEITNYKPAIFNGPKINPDSIESFMHEFNGNTGYQEFIDDCCKELLISRPRITVDERVHKIYLPELLYDPNEDVILLDSHFMRDEETTLFSLAYALRRKGFFVYEKDDMYSRWSKIECASYALYRLKTYASVPQVLKTNYFQHYSVVEEQEVIKEYRKKLDFFYGPKNE